MKFKTPSLKLITFAVLFTATTATHAFSTFALPSAWDPGANTARVGGNPAPGGATWSIIGEGVSSAPELDQFGNPAHGSGSAATTTLLDTLNPGLNITTLINDAFNIWADVSGFTNLGPVADSGVAFGASEAGSASFGDIRIGAIDFGFGNILAHAYQPGTEELFETSITGDIHIDNSRDWVNEFDLGLVLLHEIGHALGLGHSDDMNAVMFPIINPRPFSLGLDDIAGIQFLYGAATASVVPLPGAPILFLSAIGLIGFVKRKRMAIAS